MWSYLNQKFRVEAHTHIHIMCVLGWVWDIRLLLSTNNGTRKYKKQPELLWFGHPTSAYIYQVHTRIRYGWENKITRENPSLTNLSIPIQQYSCRVASLAPTTKVGVAPRSHRSGYHASIPKSTFPLLNESYLQNSEWLLHFVVITHITKLSRPKKPQV